MADISSNDNSIYILRSVDNALRLIDVLCEVEEIGVTELGKEMGISKSAAFRLLMTLKKWGYIRKNVSNDKYRLGMKFAYIGTIVSNRQEIIRYSRVYLEELSWDNKESAHLAIMEDDYNIRFLDKVIGGSLVHMESFVGAKKPSYCTGTGKVLLAYLPTKTILSYLENQDLERFTEHTITDKNKFLDELKKIRRQGYAVDNEEIEIGLTCYAAPIFDTAGDAIAAISLSGPTGRMKKNSKNIILSIKNASEKISQSIR